MKRRRNPSVKAKLLQPGDPQGGRRGRPTRWRRIRRRRLSSRRPSRCRRKVPRSSPVSVASPHTVSADSTFTEVPVRNSARPPSSRHPPKCQRRALQTSSVSAALCPSRSAASTSTAAAAPSAATRPTPPTWSSSATVGSPLSQKEDSTSTRAGQNVRRHPNLLQPPNVPFRRKAEQRCRKLRTNLWPEELNGRTLGEVT